MIPWLALILLLVPTSEAFAVVSTSHLPSDAAASALVETSGGAFRFATEVLVRDEDEDGKLEIRPRPVRAPGDRVVSKELEDWRNGAPVPFTLTFAGASRVTMTVTPRHRARSVTNLPVFTVSSELNELFVRTEARMRGARVTASNLVLNGTAIADSSTAVDNGSGAMDILRIRGGSLAAGFTLTGSLTMSWSHRRHGGHEEERAKLDVQIWGAKVVEADTTPPVVTITAPSSGSFVTTARPTLTASYADSGSGLDLASIRLMLDGVNRTAEAQVTGSALTFLPTPGLADGLHSAEVFVRDTAGNEGRASAAFTTDTAPPDFVFSSPGEQPVVGDPTPAIALAFSDATSGVSPSTLRVTLDGLALDPTCAVGPSSAVCEPSSLSEGFHTAMATVRDLAGNTATAGLVFRLVLDVVPPSIVLDTPSEGSLLNSPQALVSGSVTDDGQVASIRVDGVEATLNQDRFSTLVSLSEGVHAILVEATDATGKQTAIVRTVTMDRTPPRLTVETPKPGQPQLTNREEVRVSGAVADESGLAGLTIQQNAVPLSDGRFQMTVALASGENQILFRAVDNAGNEATTSLEVVRFALPDISITSPQDLQFLAATTVDVSGTLSDGGSTVSVNGAPAVVSGSTFLARGVPLLEGGNILTATATDAGGHAGVTSIHVVRDLTPPRLAIHYPLSGATIFESPVTVSGMVNDIVAGTVNIHEANVTVNGRAASVANRSFAATSVPLVPGTNILRVEAVDASGNVGEQSITVYLAPPGVPRIELESGAHQEAVIGSLLPDPLVVTLLDAAGNPVSGQPVLFKLRASNGGLDGGRRRLVVNTDAGGRASARFTLGTRAGVGNQTVEASAPGFQGVAAFAESARPGSPERLLVDSGDQQVGIAGRQIPRPFVAVVTDAGHNRLEGVVARFTVVKGQGRFTNSLGEVTVTSDSDGRLIVPFLLGPEEGVANNVVEARLDGLAPSPIASFTASGRVAGAAAATSISGVVLDNSNLPIAGVSLRILDTPIATQTDENGLFQIQNAPVGTVKLIVDGSTALRPGSWPDLEFVLTTVPGRDNTVNMPIYLLPLDLQSGLLIDETHGGTLTLPEVPGFGLEVAPGSVTFPSGSRSGVVSVTVVHNDKVPMVPNFGQQPRFIVTIQPAGARFEPPARLTLPNLEGLAPGEVTELYSFDHDLGHFVSIGPATVSEDGSLIVSDPGVGVVKAGWHCGGNPSLFGTAHACPQCMNCFLNRCLPHLAEGLFCQAGPLGDACEINRRCKGGLCIGESAHVSQVLGPCVVEPGSTANFVAVSNGATRVDWLTPGGVPSSGAGLSHQATYANLGTFNVEAGCRIPSASTIITVARPCSEIVPNGVPTKIDDTAPIAEFGHTIPGIRPEFQGCAEGVKWCFRLVKLGAYYHYQVYGGTNIDVTGAYDPVVRPDTCAAIIADLQPSLIVTDEGPLRRTYWSRAFTEDHEMAHVASLLTDFFPPLLSDLDRLARDPANCTACKSPVPEAFSAATSALFLERYRNYLLTAETEAHAVSNPKYAGLVAGIRARARVESMGTLFPWPQECQ